MSQQSTQGPFDYEASVGQYPSGQLPVMNPDAFAQMTGMHPFVSPMTYRVPRQQPQRVERLGTVPDRIPLTRQTLATAAIVMAVLGGISSLYFEHKVFGAKAAHAAEAPTTSPTTAAPGKH